MSSVCRLFASIRSEYFDFRTELVELFDCFIDVFVFRVAFEFDKEVVMPKELET